MAKDFFNTAGLYLICAALLTFYGIQVCPFLETMTPWELGLTLAACFAVGLVFRTIWIGALRTWERRHPQHIDMKLPWRYLQADLGSWIFVGIITSVWNHITHEFPLESGAKIVLGCLILGVFSSLSLSLSVEHRLMDRLAGTRDLKVIARTKFMSVATKFLLFVGFSFAAIACVVLLLVFKDIHYIVTHVEMDEPFSFRAVIAEISFVLAILFVGTLFVALRYSKNLRKVLQLQMCVFDEVEKGNYQVRAPLVTRDEFSIIAKETNRMIEGLEDRERIKNAFGKYMSPAVASAILDSEEHASLGGRETTVTVLFVDLANFTRLSELCQPTDVVDILNTYFSMVVEKIHQHQGIVDKFIGDAAMAVFGLDDLSTPNTQACLAAKAIRQGLDLLNKSFPERGLPVLENRIGIHCGKVVAGNIGSEERLEYTVIGDTVNIAARLEELCKEIGVPIVVSEQVFDHLKERKEFMFSSKGNFQLKGKSSPTAVYALEN